MSMPDLDDDVERVMDMGFGRRVLRHLVKTGLYSDGFSSDPLVLAYNAGMRHVARELDERIKKQCPDKWLLMQREELKSDDDAEKEVRDA